MPLSDTVPAIEVANLPGLFDETHLSVLHKWVWSPAKLRRNMLGDVQSSAFRKATNVKLPSFRDRDTKLLLASPLLDYRWYAERARVATKRDAVKHYLSVGASEGIDPSPYFSTAFYREAYPDTIHVNPLVHFLRHGQHEGRSTSYFFRFENLKTIPGSSGHPLVSYLNDWRGSRLTGIPIWDVEYYCWQRNSDANNVPGGIEPFCEFLSTNAGFLADPHPLFSCSFYLENNPDVARSRMNPLLHYMLHGAKELRDPHPLFDSRHYARQISSKDEREELNPLIHFIRIGSHRGLSPNATFDPSYYNATNPDVAAAGMNPLIHYVIHGQAEGRKTIAPDAFRSARISRVAHPLTAKSMHKRLSVVMPTYNRADVLDETLRTCIDLAPENVEFIIVDDGSTDNTGDVLAKYSGLYSSIRFTKTANNGPGHARNLGVQLASNEIILFIGDDIRPINEDFFRVHCEFHDQNPDLGKAMLGKIVWPSDRLLPVNFVMKHIQGRGGEQFGFADMTPYEDYDWRFFYTSNLSIKKAEVTNWNRDGFSDAFRLYGFEDIELGYRIDKMRSGLAITYDPAAVATHIHPYKFLGFVNRQVAAGRMAKVFLDLHPEAVSVLGLEALISDSGRASRVSTVGSSCYLGMFEGLKCWISAMEADGQLGNHGYHDELLSGFFELAFRIGFVCALSQADGERAATLRWAFEAFSRRVQIGIRSELGFRSAAPLFG